MLDFMGLQSLVTLAGGLGMFLLGIHHVCDSLRRALQKLVAGKLSGVVSGAVFTALVQSSSAAILTVIGFVSAGLVTHGQAVAVVMGANLGTTATTWLVAVFGLKLKISAAALPMIGLGGFLWILAKGRTRACGAVLAGFGLLFTGIEYMQGGMAGFDWNLAGAGGGAGGVWLLAGIGVLMTIVMQSSSAAIATTLVALASGALTLDQAFALVVGQNLGTTATAALAAIGAGLAVRRTAIAHILFNSIISMLALLCLPYLAELARWSGGHMGGEDVITLAAFHTLFKLAGLLIFFPWMGAFARMIEWMTGKGEITAVARLDPTLAKAGGPVAMEAGWRAMVELANLAFAALARRCKGQPANDTSWREEIPKITGFIEKLRFESTESQSMPDRRARLWHAIDHFERLADNLAEPAEALEAAIPAAEIESGIKALEMWRAWAAAGMAGSVDDAVDALAACSANYASLRKTRRDGLLEQLGYGNERPSDAMGRMEALRWLDGSFYHAWRLADSLRHAAGGDGAGRAG
jgi:phosphate:Na+ symporter